MRDAFEIVLMLVAFLGGWVLKYLHERIGKLEAADESVTQALNNLRVELPTHYVRHTDFKDSLDNIFSALRRIEDRIENKADKVKS
jgi:hypothetical protein